ncbi:MAG TPA: DinB family protein [Acidimicrobiales bacterium]|nr:DinB family protein [Acidimicrobiales bacterium]
MAALSLVERLQATPSNLVSLISTAPPASLTRSPMRGEWSAATVMAHLADAEAVYGVRIRHMLADDQPTIAGYDEKAWVDRFAPSEPDAAASLTRFRVLRESLLRILATLEDAEWERVGNHEEIGEMSVRAMVERVADHDRNHLDQIRRALA